MQALVHRGITLEVKRARNLVLLRFLERFLVLVNKLTETRLDDGARANVPYSFLCILRSSSIRRLVTGIGATSLYKQ